MIIIEKVENNDIIDILNHSFNGNNYRL